MLSPINTGGFDVSVMPTYKAPDPQLLAKYDPMPYLHGAQVAQDIGKAYQSLQEQPSQTASDIAQNTQKTAEDTGLANLPLGGAAFKLGEGVSHSTEFNPATSTLDTNAYTTDKNGNKIPLGTVSTQQAPTGQVMHVIKGEGGNTEVTKETWISTVAGQPATIWDQKSGSMIKNDAAKPRPGPVDTQTMQNPRMYGDAALDQQIGDVYAALKRSSSKEEQDMYQARIDELQAEQSSRVEAAKAKAEQDKANALKAAGANSTALEIQDKKNQGQLANTSAKSAASLAELEEKGAQNWDIQDEHNINARAVALIHSAFNPQLDEDTRNAAIDHLRKIDKMIQQRQAYSATQNQASASSTVSPGQAGGNQPQVMTPEQVRAWAKQNPGKTLSYVTVDGRPMNFTPTPAPVSAAAPIPASQ
jgi:hypothetical protein